MNELISEYKDILYPLLAVQYKIKGVIQSVFTYEWKNEWTNKWMNDILGISMWLLNK